MRMMIALAACVALSGCVTSEPPPVVPVVPPGFNAEHDAHCRSLQMMPGSLVYIQCRLAMAQTQRRAEEGARNLLTRELGFVSTELDLALRDDIFCNYNESSKQAVAAVEPAQGASAAYNACLSTRARLERQIRTTQPMQAETTIAAYSRVAIATNEATISEARAFR